MEKPFPAYTGDEPYVFVCYAHEDSGTVYPEMAWLINLQSYGDHNVDFELRLGIAVGICDEWMRNTKIAA